MSIWRHVVWSLECCTNVDHQLNPSNKRTLDCNQAPGTPYLLSIFVSASGGIANAIKNAKQIGPLARSLAFFIRPRLTWRPVPPFSSECIAAFQQAIDIDSQLNRRYMVVHGSYLINCGSHDAALRAKSVALMMEEISKCQSVGIPLYVFHPGSCTGTTATQTTKKNRKKRPRADDAEEESDELTQQLRAQSLSWVADCMVQVLNATNDVTLCVENMSGQGNVLGRSFEELRVILDAVATADCTMVGRIGVCLDTCHAFASGWPMATADQCEQMMQAFDQAIGSDWLNRNVLKVVHVNDSLGACGSRVDRHANIGQGKIGLPAFAWLMHSDRFNHLPMILETPREAPNVKKQNKPKDYGHIPSPTEELELLYALVND